MNRMQKIAWWTVIWILIGAVLAAIAVGVLLFIIGLPWKIAQAGLGFLGIAGLAGLGSLIFKKDQGTVTCDERDKLINSQAAVAGFAVAYLVTGLACMLPFCILGYEATITVTWLPMIFGAAALASFFVHAVAILIQYGWKGKDNE